MERAKKKGLYDYMGEVHVQTSGSVIYNARE